MIFQPTPETPPKSSITPLLQSLHLHNSNESIGDGFHNIHDELQCSNTIPIYTMKNDLLKDFDMAEPSDPVTVLPLVQDLKEESIEVSGQDDCFRALRASPVAEVSVYAYVLHNIYARIQLIIDVQ